MSAVWADYVDARRRLVHEWREQGNSPGHIARRLDVAPELVDLILRQTVDPPQPGSVRAERDEWKRRALAAEATIHVVRTTPPPVPPPTDSEVRSLTLDPHPAACGCQYWLDTPLESAGDKHNPHCQYAPKPA